MNAGEFRRWAGAALGRAPRPAARRFLSLAAEWLDAAGPGHFIESSVDSRLGKDRVKLALVLEDGRGELARDAARRDAPEKSRRVAELLDELGGGRYDVRAAGSTLGLLRRWGLRGSLMASVDFEREDGCFGKVSVYGYLPGPDELAALLEPFGLQARAGALRPLAGSSLAFFGVDLPPGQRAALKLYNKTPFPDRTLSPRAARAAAALLEAGALRDVTRLTRVGGGTPKEYLGFARGVPLAALTRLRLMGGPDGWLARAARGARGQRARFVGLHDGEVEVYFDRGGFGPAEDGSA